MLNEIKEQVSKVISYSQGIPDPKVDDLMQEWLDAKLTFIEAWGGPIYEVPEPVYFKLDSEDQKKLFNEFVDLVCDTFHNFPLGDFIMANEETFFENKVAFNYDKYNNIVIPAGMKLIKAFKYFEHDKGVLHILQSKASQIIQEDKIEGKLCFSVHPLDFLSSSLNNYNWRSCHALDGEYRSGNLSYMLDSCTVICYLKGADNEQIPLFPQDVLWNSKKWRVLLFMSDSKQMIFAGRQYPFSSKYGLDLAKQYFLTSLKLHFYEWSRWENKYIEEAFGEYELSDKFFPYKGELKGLCAVVEDEKDSLQYNDLLHSTTYKRPYYTIKNNRAWYNDLSGPFFKIGKPVKCLHCGNNWIEESETMRCPDCELKYGHEENDTFTTCDCCGSRMYRDIAIYVSSSEEHVCERCFENECFVCSCCGEVYYLTHQIYDETTGEYICKYCYNEKYE